LFCRNIEFGMMIRRTFAGSIVALLLAVSPLAAACDLSCALPSMNSDCHSRQIKSQDSTSGDMKMDGMAMDGMTMQEMSSGEAPQVASAISEPNARHSSTGEMGPCERQACDSDSAVSAKASGSADSHFHFVLAINETPRVDSAPPNFRDARDDVARHRQRDRIPLSISLRI
jgi:hypothetical protein